MARSERDRKAASRVLGACGFAVLFVALQGIYASLLDDEVKREACNVGEHSGGYFTIPALVAIAAVVIATGLAIPRPRWAAGVLGVAVVASIVFAVRGGWGASGCAFGV